MESINDKKLNNAAILFVAVIGIVLLGQWWMAPSYRVSNDAVLQKITGPQALVLPNQLAGLAGENYTALIITGKIEQADLPFTHKLIIPFAELLDKKKLKLLPKDHEVLIFGETEAQALLAMQLLTAKGFDNLRAVANDLETNRQFFVKGINPNNAFRKNEKADYDYARFFKTNKGAAPAADQPTTVTIKAKGGCS